ncbi:MAG: VWA domain-containing protein [Acidobacteriota bacterium]
MKSALLAAAVAVLLLLPAGVSAGERKPSALPDKWRVWLEEEVYPLISREERKAFLALDTDEQREAFAARMWALWGSQTGLGTSFHRLYDERLQECRTRFGNTTEDRARVLLLHGPPDEVVPVDCSEVFNPLEFWRYARLEGIGQQVTMVFYKPYGLGRFRLWDPFETRLALYSTPGQMKLQRATQRIDRPEWECGDADELLGLIAAAEFWLKDSRVQAALTHVPEPAGLGKESAAARFLEFSTVLPKNAEAIPFTVTTAIGGRKGSKVRVTLTAEVARQGLGTTKVGDQEVIQLDVTGELSREGEMADQFRYAFTFPVASAELPIVVERDLWPGRYKLRMKVQDSNSRHAGVQETAFEVPLPSVAPESAAERAGAAAVARLAGQSAEAVLSLQGPEGEGVTGVQRFTALAAPSVARVEFLLNGRSVLTKNRPPFEVELDLGPFPRLATVTAVGFDASGQEVDRKQMSVNVGRERFLVRLQPVSAADRKGEKVHAQVAVNVPPDKKLARLELYWNESLLATLFQAPFDLWVPVKDSNEIGYLRALATLDDGAQAEDVEFVNAPQFLAGVRVEAVELPVTVLGEGKKPVDGLKQADFSVEEDGVVQQISHFSLQEDLPIRLGLVLDTSGSMEKTLPEVQRVVLGFLRNLLRPRDRAFIEAFSDKPALIEGFSADFAALERALLGLRADRETALWDATVYGLFQFSGVRGRKAMIVLTDGEDNTSRMSYDRALDYARRSGVTIYTIGIDLPITKVRARSQLTRLARATGGEAFFLPRASSLQPVYDQINRELRSQYLLAYTSTSELPLERFRKIEVKVKVPHVEVRTLSGYYPGQ